MLNFVGEDLELSWDFLTDAFELGFQHVESFLKETLAVNLWEEDDSDGDEVGEEEVVDSVANPRQN